MIGRGVDQIMRRRVDPELYERWARSALRYIELAEQTSSSLPREVDPEYIWGDTLDRLASFEVDLRIANLETSLTERGDPWPGKGIHYRAHPGNVDCLVAAGIDCVSVANNHVLDWSQPGLFDTLAALSGAGVASTGAGETIDEAWAPVSMSADGAIVVLGVGSVSSGIDPAWAAAPERPGVALLGGLSNAWADRVAGALDTRRPPRGVSIVSVHWGPNWGYSVSEWHRRFSRALIDGAGVDIVHGHSAHHPLGFEVYRDRLILYGCGDLINDYEGISGHEEFRPGLGAWWMVDVDSRSGSTQGLRLIPTRVRRFRLETPGRDDQRWLAGVLEREAMTPGVSIQEEDGLLTVVW